ncbi:MAG TPA: (2Fe-2S)-binding protein [Burkholderiales bacterium]|nr:(2Fe-2S)-binding protein [Burkholderiales bacterium]
MYICICNAITEREIRRCAQDGAATVEVLAMELGLGSGCGRCTECAADLLKEIQGGTLQQSACEPSAA